MEGKETICKIMRQIEDHNPKVKNITIRVSEEISKKFEVSKFSIIVNEYLHNEETKGKCNEIIIKTKYTLLEDKVAMYPYISHRSDKIMKEEANKLKIEKMELYNQLIKIYVEGRVKFDLTNWAKYIKFNNI